MIKIADDEAQYKIVYQLHHEIMSTICKHLRHIHIEDAMHIGSITLSEVLSQFVSNIFVEECEGMKLDLLDHITNMAKYSINNPCIHISDVTND